MNIPEELSRKHQRRASARSQRKHLLKMISTGSPQDLLTRTCTRSFKDLLEDFTWISTRAPHKTVINTPAAVERILQDLGTKSFMEPPLTHGICKIFMQGPIWKDPTGISTTSSVKDLYWIMQGPVREDLTKISTRFSQKDLYRTLQGPLNRISPGSS